MRIAIGGISNENTSFSPILNRLESFSVWTDEAQMASGRYPFVAHYAGATFLPTLFASSLPGGPIAAETYRHLKAGIVDRLRTLGPLDGVYLDLHGAMFVEGMRDAEADLAGAVRALVGPDALIAASMDLHGNVSQAFVDQVDIITAYRTAPHRDMEATRQRACELLVQALQRGVRPQVALVPIPVLLVGD
jgi:microcystin degradation protein MlrC